jgi:hypothetical protein
MTTRKTSACDVNAGTRAPGRGCGCGRVFDRRDFLCASGAGAAGLLLGGEPTGAMAGPFARQEIDHLVPADKRLSPEWRAALFERGEPTTCRGDELRYIGMPIGGICCGQLYLGGDGRLWLWDVFGAGYQSDYGGMSRGPHYADPPEPFFPLEQGCAVKIAIAGQPDQVRSLDARGFADVTFIGQYPIGRAGYRDEACPVAPGKADLVAPAEARCATVDALRRRPRVASNQSRTHISIPKELPPPGKADLVAPAEARCATDRYPSFGDSKPDSIAAKS